VASIVLSPCHLASIPLIVAFLGQQRGGTRTGAVAIASAFALGILLTIALVGAVTASLGRMLGDVGSIANYAVAAILILLGLHFLDVFSLPWSGAAVSGSRGRGARAAFLLGLLFGIGVGPCTFAFMAPMIAVAFKASAGRWIDGVGLLLLYGAGHASIIVLAGASAEWAQRYLNWTERSPGTRILRRVCGALVILGGIYLIYTA